jgi:hypothetical protein
MNCWPPIIETAKATTAAILVELHIHKPPFGRTKHWMVPASMNR